MIWYVIVIWVFSGFLCAYIASEKNRGGMGWFFAGLIFGIFAVIAIVAVPALSEDEKKQREEVRNDRVLNALDSDLEESKQKVKEKL